MAAHEQFLIMFQLRCLALRANIVQMKAKRTSSITFRITEEARAILETLSEKNGLKMNAIVEMAIRAFGASPSIKH
jgi:hypothetical protein